MHICTCRSLDLFSVVFIASINYLESEEETVSFIHPSYGTITYDVAYLTDTLHIYSTAVVFSSDSSSSSCAVLFFDSMRNLKAATNFVKRLA